METALTEHTALPTNEQNWPLAGVPVYDGGIISGEVLEETWGFAEENPSLLLSIGDTNTEEFAAYINKVQNEGFTTVQRADRSGVIAYRCSKENISFYTYCTPGTGDVRIILDNSKTVPPEEFSYAYEAKEGETNAVFLFGLETNMWRSATGQFLFAKLADNRIFVIDGGNAGQPNAEEFFRIAREITGTPENEKIRIACWFITHGHCDHTTGMDHILKTYSDQIILERIMYNYKDCTDFTYGDLYPNVLYHLPRTGETIQFGNMIIEVLYTFEDLLVDKNMTCSTRGYNDCSTVLKLNFDGISCMILGDIHMPAADILMKNHTAEQLKSDVVQISHHGGNYMPDLYKSIDAKIALLPETFQNAHADVMESIWALCDACYSSEETVGVRMEDGEAKVFYRIPGVFNYRDQEQA